jgi:PTS system mannose-specific IIA component
MIGLVIVAHGGLGEELLAATIHVVGPQPGSMAIATRPDDDLSAKQAEIDAAIETVNTGDGVIVVTDMFGGTPCNLSIGAMREDEVEIVYGANLPMLVKLAKCREKKLAEAANCAVEAGIKYIDCASNMLKPAK